MPTLPPALPGFWGAHAWVADLQAALVQYLIDSVDSMSADRVFPSVWTQELHIEFPPADRFITVFFRDFPVDQIDVLGGGQYNTAFDAAVDVTAYTRVEADIENRSAVFLTEQVNGVYDFAKQVLTPMQMWPGPLIDSGVSMLRRPARLKPGWKVTPKTSGQGQRWGIIPFVFELSFVADLSVPYPGSTI